MQETNNLISATKSDNTPNTTDKDNVGSTPTLFSKINDFVRTDTFILLVSNLTFAAIGFLYGYSKRTPKDQNEVG